MRACCRWRRSLGRASTRLGKRLGRGVTPCRLEGGVRPAAYVSAMAEGRAGPARGPAGLVGTREAKRRRIAELVSTPGLTGKALARVAKKLAEPGSAEEVTLHAVYDTIGATFNSVGVTIKLPMAGEGPPFDWRVCRFDKLLRRACRESSVYEELFAKAVRLVNGRPLSLVLYMDELTPGDALALRRDRQFGMTIVWGKRKGRGR